MRNAFKVVLVVLGLLVVLGIAGGVVVSKATITEVSVSGQSFYKAEEIEDLVLDSTVSKNTIICYLQNRFGTHKDIPFVERYQIEIKDMHSVEIIVYEKNIIGYIDFMGSYMYIDRDGMVVDSSQEPLPGICEVEGIQFSKIVLHEQVETDNKQAFQEVLTMTQIFEKNNIKVKKISFDERNHVTVKIKKILVELGSSDNIDLKLAELADILPQLKGMKGTLYLDEYESGTGTAYIFKPAKSTKKKDA